MNRKTHMDTKQRFSIKKFKIGAASVLVGTVFAAFASQVQVQADQIEASQPSTETVASQPEESAEDQEPAQPVEAKSLETPASASVTDEPAVPTAEQAPAEAANAEKEEVAAQAEPAPTEEKAVEPVPAEPVKEEKQEEPTPALPKQATTTKKTVSYKPTNTVPTNPENNALPRPTNEGKEIPTGTNFRVAAADDISGFSKSPVGLADAELLDENAKRSLREQIVWANFKNTTTSTVENLGSGNILQVGTKLTTMLTPDYIVEMTVKELKPFDSTEIYRDRVAGTNVANTYVPNKTNYLASYNNQSENGRLVNVKVGNQDLRWSNLSRSGFSTGQDLTNITASENGGNIGVTFDVKATYKGREVPANIVLADGEEAKGTEFVAFHTTGTPFELLAIVGQDGKGKPRSLSANNLNGTALGFMARGLNAQGYAHPDQVNAGLGSQVFGPLLTRQDQVGVPMVLTTTEQFSVYVSSAGNQSAMIGFVLFDEGDAPESTYLKAKHLIRETDTTTQPFLGSIKADVDLLEDKAVVPFETDDRQDNPDEGVRQLMGDAVEKNNNYTLHSGHNNTYSLKIQADPNGNPTAYVRGYVDFNNDGTFSPDEQSDLVVVNSKGEQTLVFNNVKQIVDTSIATLGTRVRISKSESEVNSPFKTAFSGEVEDFKIQLVHPPRGDKEETSGYAGEKQSAPIKIVDAGKTAYVDTSGDGSVQFTSFGEIEYDSSTLNAIDRNVPIKIVDPSGNLVDTYTEEGVGTYTLTNGGTTIEFQPVDSFIGKAKGVVLRATDKNGNSTGWTALTEQHGLENVNKGTHTIATNTMDAVYIPEVINQKPKGSETTTEDIQGKKQSTDAKALFKEVKLDGQDPEAGKAEPLNYESLKLIDPATNAPAASNTVTVENQGTYTLLPNGTIEFQPLSSFTGTATPIQIEIADKTGDTARSTYTPTVTTVTPTATPKETQGPQGVAQSGKVEFAPGNESVPMNDKVAATFDDGTTEKVVKGEGTYTVAPDGTVTFKPEPNFTGTANGVTVKRVDINGTEASAKYTPTVTAITPTATPATTSGLQGEVQTAPIKYGVDGEEDVEGTVNFKKGADSAPINPESVTLLDEAGQPATGKVPAKDTNGAVIGTYELVGGNIVFTPNKDYTGAVAPAPVKVRAADTNGTEVETTYTPAVTSVTPTGTPKETEGPQGVAQSGKVEFAGGDAKVPMNDSVPATFDDGSTKKVVEGEGTYTVAPDGTVTFTPEEKFTGTAKGVTVKRVDINGTPATAKYTPTVTPVTPTAEPSESTGKQGAVQKSPIVFGEDSTNGSVNFKQGNPNVPINKETVTLLGEDGQPATEVVAKDVDGNEIGTYKIENGNIVFTPKPEYNGKNPAQPVKIQAKDANGTAVETTYTPKVTPVVPTGTPVTSEGPQGLPQEGTPTFQGGDQDVPVEISAENPAKLVDPATGEPTDKTTLPAKDAEGNEVGTYTIDPATGKVTFTPNKDYTGEKPVVGIDVVAKDTNGTKATAKYTPKVTPVVPTGTPVTSEGPQGLPQEGTPTFEGGDEKVPVTISAENPAKLVDPATGEPTDEKKLPAKDTEGNVVGTYTIDPATGKVTFVPNKDYTGEKPVVGVDVVAKDTNGTSATAKYTPKVTPVTPVGTPKETTDIQGATQTGKVEFTGGDAKVPMDDTVPATFEDGTTEKVVPGEGTYTVAPDGTVTFKPEPNFTGPAKGVTVKRVDQNGTPATATYTPTVTPVTPVGTPKETTDIQGATQTGKVEFTGGDAKVPMDDTVPATFEDGTTEKVVPGEGTYTVAPDGTVTFTPEKTFTGTAKGVTVKRVDKNGTPATAKYTPVVLEVTPTSEASATSGIQGAKQKSPIVLNDDENTGTVNFKEGNPSVPVKPESITLVDAEGNPAPEVKVPGQGTYTIEDGAIVFTPEPNFTGVATPVTIQAEDENGKKIKTTYTPTVTPVTPTGTPAETEGPQGQPQEGTPTFTPGNDNVPLDDTVPATFEDGTTEKVVPGEGTYTVAPDGKVTFTPEPNFVGRAKGVTVKRVDKNGTPVTASYTPTVTPVTPTGTPVETEGPQGQPQEGTPTFTPGNDNVPLDDTVPATFEDGTTEKVVPGEGTYTVAPDGKVTFTPEPNFVGRAKGVTVKRVDKNGTPVTASYTPTVTPVTPTGTPAETEGPQGQPQEGTPTFTPGNDNVPLDDTVPATFEDGTTEKVVPGEGTYTVAPDGKVTFTPEPNFVGRAKGVTVKRVDKNGTPVTATYTPIVTPKPVKTTFVDEKGNELIPEENGTNPGAKIPGYYISGTTIDPDGNVRHVYKPLTTVFVDDKGMILLPDEKGTNPSATIPGYYIERTETDEHGNVKHIYKKVTTSYVDENGNPIQPPKDGSNPNEAIPGYRVVSTTTDEHGNVVNVYAKVTTSYVDENGNPLAPSLDGKHPSANIPGYELVTTTVDANGNTVHVYRKVPVTPEKPTVKVTTSYVDENGNPLAPSLDGKHPSATIPGYELVTTTVDASGNTVHVYRKVPVAPGTPTAPVSPEVPTQPMVNRPVAPSTPVVPSTPVAPATEQSLPHTGTESSSMISLVGLLALAGAATVAKKKRKED